MIDEEGQTCAKPTNRLFHCIVIVISILSKNIFEHEILI